MKINFNPTNFQANKMTKRQAEFMDDALSNSHRVDIICHDSTDKDAANSALLMWEYLNSKSVPARVILSQDLSTLKLRNENCNIVQADTIEANPETDTVLCVDFSSIGRMHKNSIPLFKNAKTVVCLDHHEKNDMFQDDCIEINKSLNDDELPDEVSLRYIDTSAKSATSIIYRFFEALDREISEDTAYDILSGLASDSEKKGLMDCSGKTGEIKLKDEFIKDKNAYEVYSSVISKISEENIAKIASHIDIMSDLTQDEEDFYKSLFDRLQFSKDNKAAWVEIPFDDEGWNRIGGDNSRTSSILKSFRLNVLNDENYKDTEKIAVFYRAKDNYRVSMHSKNNDMIPFYDLAHSRLDGKYDAFSVGGHDDRGGGKISPKNNAECHDFVLDIVDCLDKTL